MKISHANRLLRRALSLLTVTALLFLSCALWVAADPTDGQLPGDNTGIAADGDTDGNDAGDNNGGDAPGDNDTGDTPPVGDTSSDTPPSDDTSSDLTSDPDDNTTSDTSSDDESDTSSDASDDSSDTSDDSSDTSSDTSSEDPNPAFPVTLRTTGSYRADGTLSVTATIEGLDGNRELTGFFFELTYDPNAFMLANQVGSDNVLDCVTKKPGDRWENLTKLTENGKIAVAVGVTENLAQTVKTDGALELTFRFTVPANAPEKTELTVPDASVKATAVDLTSIPGQGMKLELTRAAAPDTMSSTPPAAGDVGTFFPFLLGTGALLGIFTAVRIRRKAL